MVLADVLMNLPVVLLFIYTGNLHFSKHHAFLPLVRGACTCHPT